jgi:hypothetical protein
MNPPLLSSLLLAGLAVGTSLASALPASALEVVVEGRRFELSVVEVAPSDQPDWFESLADGGRMPWWGDEQRASLFAERAGDGLGPLGPDLPFSEFGPLFAFGFDQGDVLSVAQLIVPPADSQGVFPTPADGVYRFAVGAPLAPVSSVPGPLPILGLGLGYGWSRRLRRRVAEAGASAQAGGRAAGVARKITEAG